MMNRRAITIILTLFLAIQGGWAQLGDIWNIEPPMWWIGMENPELQVMIYGDQVGLSKPSIKYNGVRIDRVEKTSNPNYLFIYLDIAANAKPGKIKIHLSSDIQDDSQILVYELLSRKQGSALREGFNSSDAIYLITPDRFANGDPENDQFEKMEDKLNRDHPFGRHGGDLKGIINKLDYVKDMGYTALWLNPVVENDMPGQSYHGYAATDFYKIDARYGSNQDYLTLSRECKKRGMKLIMDQIMNHCGSGHWWMDDLPDKTWIHNIDDYQQTSHKRVVLNDPYVAESDRKKFTEGWFVPTMPDMNQDNPLLADYLVQNSIWWVEFADLDGIRHDTHSYAGKEFMKAYSCRIMNEYPNFNIVGEEWSLNPAIIAKWQRGMTNPDGYISCTPSMFDFPLQDALTRSLNSEESWNSGWIVAYEALSNDFLYSDPSNLVTFPDNHDMDRFYTQINEDYDLFKMGMIYYACMRGIPQFYYGTELLMTNSQPGNHGLIRSDYPGGWEGDTKNAFTGDGLTEKEREAQLFVKTLLNWRKQSKPVHEGRLLHYAPENDVYIFFRILDEKAVMVVFNKGKEKRKFISGNYPEIRLKSTVGFDVISGKKQDLTTFTLESRSAYVIELEIHP